MHQRSQFPKPVLVSLFVVAVLLLCVSCSCSVKTEIETVTIAAKNFSAEREAQFVIGVVYDLNAYYYSADSLNYPDIYDAALDGVRGELKERGVEWSFKKIPEDATQYQSQSDFREQFVAVCKAEESLKDLGEHDLAFAATDKMLASLGRSHTYFVYPPGHRKNPLGVEDHATFGGIGVTLKVIDGQFFCGRMITGGPAEKVGLKSFDRITAVNKNPVPEKLSELVSRVRGPEGTKVLITVERQGRAMDFEITRAAIQPIYANGEIVEDGKFRWGVVAISQFDDISLSNMTSLEKEKKVFSGVDGVIIDLRGNPGGYITVLKSMLEWFLPAGTETFMLSDDQQQMMFSTQHGPISDKPVVILIDGGSASASEIFTAVMQERHRATIVGEKSAGMVEVAGKIYLEYGAEMLITRQQLVTAGGLNMEGSGVSPDREVKETKEDASAARDAAMEMAKNILRDHYEGK